MKARNRFSDNDQDPWSIDWDDIIQGDRNTNTTNNRRRKGLSSQNKEVAGVVGIAAPTLAPVHVHPHYPHPHYHHQKWTQVDTTCDTQDSTTPSLSPPFALPPSSNLHIYTNHSSLNQASSKSYPHTYDSAHNNHFILQALTLHQLMIHVQIILLLLKKKLLLLTMKLVLELFLTLSGKPGEA